MDTVKSLGEQHTSSKPQQQAATPETRCSLLVLWVDSYCDIGHLFSNLLALIPCQNDGDSSKGLFIYKWQRREVCQETSMDSWGWTRELTGSWHLFHQERK